MIIKVTFEKENPNLSVKVLSIPYIYIFFHVHDQQLQTGGKIERETNKITSSEITIYVINQAKQGQYLRDDR